MGGGDSNNVGALRYTTGLAGAEAPEPCGLGPSGGIPSAIELPWPPASLSGHNSGHWRSKSTLVKKHREWARLATLSACIPVPDEGDIAISFTFHPPDQRSDRMNYANRIKAYADGIADALGVNDRRFLPSYHYGNAVAGGCVRVCIGGEA